MTRHESMREAAIYFWILREEARRQAVILAESAKERDARAVERPVPVLIPRGRVVTRPLHH